MAFVVAANSVFPGTNLPKLLGVNLQTPSVLSEDSTQSGSLDKNEVEASPSATGGSNLRDTREVKIRALQEAREARKRELERVREARKNAIEEMKTARERFKDKVQELSDERKKKIIENIDENITKHNEKWVEHWNRVLSRLTEILAKLESKTDELAAKGKDVSEVVSAIGKAKDAVSAAQAAVTAQAGKSYVITIENEENLGENVSQTVQGFKADVKLVFEKVKDARQAVKEAFQKLKGLIEPEPTEGT